MTAFLLALALTAPASAATCDSVAAMRSAPFGYQLVDRVSGNLRSGQSTSWDVTLHRGSTYRVVACGSDGTRDIDLRLWDENHNLIDQDRSSDNLPEVDSTPKWTGAFNVEVEMYRAVGAAGYVLYLYRR